MSIWHPIPRLLRPRCPWKHRPESWPSSRWLTDKRRAFMTHWESLTSILHHPVTATWSDKWTCRTPETSYIISAGTHAAPAGVHTLRTRMWKGGI